MILSDNETKVDLLNSEAIAITIVNLITERPNHPITIGIHGDWGAGKSSVLEMIENSLSDEKDVVVIKFNGWRFQGFEDAKISIIEEIVTQLVEKRSLFTKAKDEVTAIYKRIDWLKAAKKGGAIALNLLSGGIPVGTILHSVTSKIEDAAKNPKDLATSENLQEIATEAKSFLKEKESKNVPKEIDEFRKAFDELVKKAGIKQLIVLVDDLDRCLPETTIETLEAIRLFVFTTKTAFVIAADEGMIEYSVRRHFPDYPDASGTQAYSRNYLEKLIQVPFRIPILGEVETKIYVTLLLIGAELGEDDPSFEKLIKVARERLKKPWESTPLDSADIRDTLGTQAAKAQNALVLSEQISPILASGTRGNPRQIKRFLNTILLRQRMADARGFGSSIQLPVMAKLMIAERFIPRLFEQIATLSASSADGKCKELAHLEPKANGKENSAGGVASNNGNTKIVTSFAVDQDLGGKVVEEWLASPATQKWASIEPMLKDLDLRPYIFISKDKRDYFGVSSSIGSLTGLVEKLFGAKMVIQAFEPEIKNLSPSDARQVFTEMRTRILNGSSFDKEPAGIAGLTLLIKVHAALQPDLLDFLEGIPTDNCGAWILKGWEGVIIDSTVKERFDKLIGTWAKASSPFLKTAASSILKFAKK